MTRSDAAISIHLQSTLLSRKVELSRIYLGSLVKKAVSQLEASGFYKRRMRKS